MHKYLVLLSFVIVTMLGCKSDSKNQEQAEVINPLKELKLDSIRSIVTVIVDEGDELKDTRGSISGTYKTDQNQMIRSIRFSLKDLNIVEEMRQFNVDMINLEEWDSSRQNAPTVDSAFVLNHVTHLALSKITLGNITNELLLPIQINRDPTMSHIEGKTTLTLKDWGFDHSQEHKLHLGLSLYTLSEN